MKTYSAKPAEVIRQWYVVDARNLPLGRLATEVAEYLMGKHKAMYTPHIDCGDYVVVTHALELKVTGNKMADKKYYRHSGYPGGIKETTLAELLQKHPEKVIQHAVAGMLPKNRLRVDRLARLKVYPGPDHPHAAQQPKNIGESNG